MNCLEATNLDEILTIKGIVLRKLPTYTTNTTRGYDGKGVTLKPNDELMIGPDSTGLVTYRSPVSEALAGKWMVTFKHNTNSTVTFRKGYYGVGSTIEEAYLDYVTNQSVSL